MYTEGIATEQHYFFRWMYNTVWAGSAAFHCSSQQDNSSCMCVPLPWRHNNLCQHPNLILGSTADSYQFPNIPTFSFLPYHEQVILRKQLLFHFMVSCFFMLWISISREPDLPWCYHLVAYYVLHYNHHHWSFILAQVLALT